MVRSYAASILLVCILCLSHLPGSRNFTIESSDRDDHYGGLRDGFLFGHFAFPEAASNFTTLAAIEPVLMACLDRVSAQYAMLKFFSVLNLNLVEVAALTSAFPRDEKISHILNGCTPLGKTFGNGEKELLTTSNPHPYSDPDTHINPTYNPQPHSHSDPHINPIPPTNPTVAKA